MVFLVDIPSNFKETCAPTIKRVEDGGAAYRRQNGVAAQSLADGMGGVHAYVRILSSIRLASGIPERILKSEQY